MKVVGTYGDGATITLTPAEGKEVNYFKINGTPIMAQDGVTYATAYTVPAYTRVSIEVQFGTAITKRDVTFTVKEGMAWDEAEDYSGALSFGGVFATMGTAADGSVTVTLADGEYVVTADGCMNSIAVTVAGGAANVTNLIFKRNLFTEMSTDIWTQAVSADGLTVTFSNATSRLVLEADAADADLRANGVRNVKTDRPFVFPGEMLKVDFVLAGDTPLSVMCAHRLGLMTVTATAAAGLRDRLEVSVPKTVFAGSARQDIQESTDPETGHVTFWLRLRPRGLGISFR